MLKKKKKQDQIPVDHPSSRGQKKTLKEDLIARVRLGREKTRWGAGGRSRTEKVEKP